MTPATVSKVYGVSGEDTICANSGSNTIFGDAGNDRIIGGSDSDSIIGGTGNDSMHGGGNDTFCFSANFGNDTAVTSHGQTVDYLEYNLAAL